MPKLNVAPRTIFCGDNLEVLRGINSGSIDLIYLDPPFNKKKVFAAPANSSAAGAAFSDIFKQDDIKEQWVRAIHAENSALHTFLAHAKAGGAGYNYCYLVYMAIRLIECRRILNDTGSVYLHCDPTMSHYLKVAMDCIFEEGNFINEIVWQYRTGGAGRRSFAKKHDVILLYGKSGRYLYNAQKEKAYTKSKNRKAGAVNYGGGTAAFFEDENGVYNLVTMRDVWDISYIGSTDAERTGYPTQKPLALLERIIAASSDEGGVVLDPFCGCATACVAAEKLRRQWIGVDVNPQSHALAKQRLKREVPPALVNAQPPFFASAPPVRDVEAAAENVAG